MTLQEQRAEIRANIDRLQAARGAALLDGEDFDTAELVNAEAMLASLDDAEGEQVRRQRAAASQEWADRRQGLLAELQDKEEARLTAIAAAEKGLRDFVAALNDVLAISIAERNVLHRLDAGTPTALSPLEVPRRLSLLAGEVLAGVNGHTNAFALLRWHYTGAPVIADWRARERKATGIESIVKEK